MKIRMKALMCGPSGTAAPGDVIDRPQQEAEALVKGGFAEPVPEPVTYQTAEAPPAPERAEIAPARRQRAMPRR